MNKKDRLFLSLVNFLEDNFLSLNGKVSAGERRILRDFLNIQESDIRNSQTANDDLGYICPKCKTEAEITKRKIEKFVADWLGREEE